MKKNNHGDIQEIPMFPEFKELEITDHDLIYKMLWEYQPEISEFTFTNLFAWRNHYRFRWCIYNDFLIITARDRQGLYGLQPIGPGNRTDAVTELLKWLSASAKDREPAIERADQRLAMELEGNGNFRVEPIRDHFDYLYLTQNLKELTGRKYHSKRNHLSGFFRNYAYSYAPFSESLVSECLDLSERLYRMHNRGDNHNLCEEWKAIRELLSNYRELKPAGAVIRINGMVESFTFGEMLNNKTAVVHFEKANTEYKGLYAAINRMFCEYELADTEYVNREQDLGDPGLRKAKQSYHPLKLVKKYRISAA